MKRLDSLLACSSLTFLCLATPPGLRPAQAQALEGPPDDIGYNYRAWNLPASDTAGCGPVVQLETGMNYFDSQSQQFLPSRAVFGPGSDGQCLVAERVQHRVRLSSQLNIVGAVSLRMDDGLALDSTPVAVALYDPFSGAFAIVAVLTNSTAVQVSDNQVLYPDVFAGSASGVCCSILYTIEKGTFAQDCVFTGSFDPRNYGFTTNAWIEVITEFYGNVPQPDRIVRSLWSQSDPAVRAQMASPDLMDDILGFSQFVMTTGNAFTEPTPSQPNGAWAPVGKDIQVAAVAGAAGAIGQRVFLVESLPYSWLMGQLLALPECGPPAGQARLNRSPAHKTGYAFDSTASQAGPTGSGGGAEHRGRKPS